MKRPVLFASLLACASLVAIVGCGGGAGGTQSAPVPAAPAAVKLAPATFTIIIPARTASSSAKSPEYISVDTNSVSFFMTGMSSTQVVALNGSNCSTNGGTKICTADFSAPIGVNETLEVQTFESSDGSGTPLSMNSVPITVVAGQTNTPTITLNGVVASFGLVLNPASMLPSTTQTVAATYTAYDSAGDAIVGPGSLVDSAGAAVTPALSSNDSSGATSIGALSGNAWSVTETNPGSGVITFTVKDTGNPGVTVGTATLTVSTVSPSPSPTPTASPTPSPTPTPISNVIVNGTFSTGSLAPWYLCYAPRYNETSGPINASPAPVNPGSSPAPGPTPVTSAPKSTDVSIQQTTPSLALPPSGDANFVRAGYDNYGVAPELGLPGEAPYGTTPRGNTGICQDVTVPSDPAVLTFNVYEGGNDQFNKQDDEADIYPAGTFSPDGTNGATAGASVSPAVRLYAQNNCYDNQQYNQGYLAPPWGTGTSTATSTSRNAACPYYPGGIVPSGGNAGWAGAPAGGAVSLGGFWYPKQLVITGYSGQTVTLFLGVSAATNANAPGNSTGVGEYMYAFFDNVALMQPTLTSLTASPTSLSLTGYGTASFTVTEAGYRGNYTVSSSDTSRVTVTTPVASSSDTTTIGLTVLSTAQGGTALITVTDAYNQSVVVPVTITISTVTVQGAHHR